MLTKAADVYAYGCLLWSLLTSEAPYAGEQPWRVIQLVASSQRCPLELPAGAPPGVKVRQGCGRPP